jgi:hypothetical protein
MRLVSPGDPLIISQILLCRLSSLNAGLQDCTGYALLDIRIFI